MEKYSNLVFMDCEARGVSPVNGTLAEFGAVHFVTRRSFLGELYENSPDPGNPAVPLIGKMIFTPQATAAAFAAWLKETVRGRPVFVSDNPAYDFMWIAALFDEAGMENPFGHSGRRISDFWAGTQGNWSDTQAWKRFRKTKHDHNPVNDAMGNVEAFERILELMREGKG